MLPTSVIDAPSILGLKPSGVEQLPTALRRAGLLDVLGAEDAGTLAPDTPWSAARDQATGLLNPVGLARYSVGLADRLEALIARSRFPLVLGGDCSILVGAMGALRRRGRFGLAFVDGHSDFYSPSASPTGEAADMDLALVTGRGPELLTRLEGRQPLVEDRYVVALGYRDAAQARDYGSPDIKSTEILAMELDEVRAQGARAAAQRALNRLEAAPDGFWIHLDADVLDDGVMPAVDYRLPGGLTPAELSDILAALLARPGATGMTVAILNPTLDPGGEATRLLVRVLATAFSSRRVQ